MSQESVHKRWDDNGLGRVMKYWPVIIGVISLVFAFGTASQTVSSVERRVEKLEHAEFAQSREIAALQQIANEIPEIQRDIKEILKRLR